MIIDSDSVDMGSIPVRDAKIFIFCKFGLERKLCLILLREQKFSLAVKM